MKQKNIRSQLYREISFNDFILLFYSSSKMIRCQLQSICKDGTSSFVHHSIVSKDLEVYVH